MASAPDWPVHSLLNQYQPEPGWQLDKACIASYSADVRVVTAALLALSGSLNEPELGSRVQLIRAIRRLRGRVAFVVQRGRVHRPRNLPKIAALLDRFLFEAPCDERQRSWHPKFAIMRWRRVDDGAVSWRAWLGSRNLTRDLSRDAGLLVVQAADRAAGQALPALAIAAKHLQTHLPTRVGRFNETELGALADIRWDIPKGVREMHVHWLDGSRDRLPKPRSQQRVIVVSPFVDAKSMKAVAGWTESGEKPVLLAAEHELIRECSTAPDLLTQIELLTFAVTPDQGMPYEPVETQTSADAGDTEREIDRSDEARAYHAKLIYLSAGKEKRLWLGSPNLTERGWCRNFEIVAELSVDRGDPWGKVLESLAANASKFDPPAVTPIEVKDPIEELQKALCIDLRCHQVRIGTSVTVVATDWPTAPVHAVELSVGVPWHEGASVVWEWGQPARSIGDLELHECSEFLLFTLRSAENETAWLMHVPFKPALKEDRDTAAVAAYLGPDGYLSLIGEELQPTTSNGAPWDAPIATTRKGGTHAYMPRGLLSLEALLRLSLREPERLREVAKTVEMLQAEIEKWKLDHALPAEHREALAAFDRLWTEVGRPLTEKSRAADT